MSSHVDPQRTLGAAIAVLLVLQIVAVATHDRGAGTTAAPSIADVGVAPTTAPTASPAPPTSTASPITAPTTEAAEDRRSSTPTLRAITPDRASGSDAATRTSSAPARQEAPSDPAQARFEQRFPAHAAASQDEREPASTRWALLVGVNEHAGRTRDNVGSRQDAEELAQHLLGLGWRQDHVLLLTDGDATYENITQAIAWLGRKTDGASVAVFHYSGHTKKWYGQDADGDGEITDEGLWPSDNRFIIDSEWVARMAAIGAGRLWIDIGGCESAGLNDPGLERAGRLLTFSSTEQQKSYEDPSRANSVWGYYLADQALLQGLGDRDGDGNVTVEEAFNFAAPRAAQRTDGQRYGPQQAVVIDHVDGDFDLRIPPPPPEPEPEPEPSDDEDEDDDGCVLLCAPDPRHYR